MGEPTPSQRRYWRRNLALTLPMLLVWAVLTLGGVYAARDLQFTFFGWPFGFWMAAQGLLLVYWLLIWLYARLMERWERAHANGGEGPN